MQAAFCPVVGVLACLYLCCSLKALVVLFHSEKSWKLPWKAL
jgi:hypothetical protein